MVLAILAIGFGLIAILGGAILLTRDRNNRKPRPVYALSSVCGLALLVAGFIAF